MVLFSGQLRVIILDHQEWAFTSMLDLKNLGSQRYIVVWGFFRRINRVFNSDVGFSVRPLLIMFPKHFLGRHFVGGYALL